MNWTDIVALIPSGDTLTTRFIKRSIDHDELAQIITAFANTIGGKVIVGLDRANLHFVGSTLSELQLNEVTKLIFPEVVVSMASIVKGDRVIHVLNVQMGTQKPYVYNQFVYSLDESRPWSFKIKEEPVPDTVSVSLRVEQRESEPLEPNPTKAQFELPVSQVNGDGAQFNQRQLRALDYVAANGSIQNRLYRDLFSVSHKTAHIELTELKESGRLVQGGSGRSTHYRGASK